MPDPKTRLKGQISLGAAVDERIARHAASLEIRHDSGEALPAPLSSGGSIGGGSGGEPVLPESWVQSLRADGAADALSGALVLAAAGEAQLTQSAAAPHFCFDVPQLTAADGVKRTGGEFSCDASVVRTAGAQLIDGVKSFADFPLTPSAAPAADYEVANKKYVDDTVQSAGDHGELGGLSDDDHAQYALLAGRAGGQELCGGSAAGDVLTLRANSAAAKYVEVAGGDGLKLAEWLELAQSAAPAAPPAACTRIHAAAGPQAGSRLQLLDANGVVHELCAQHKQTFYVSQDGQNSVACNLNWTFGILPGAQQAAPVNFACAASFQIPAAAGDAVALTQSCGSWNWIAVKSAGGLTQSYIVLGVPAMRFAADGASAKCRAARIHARLCASDPAQLAAVKLTLADSAGTPQTQSLSISPTPSMAEYSSPVFDVSGYAEALRLSLAAYGKAHTVNGSYPTGLQVEYLALELWAQ